MFTFTLNTLFKQASSKSLYKLVSSKDDQDIDVEKSPAHQDDDSILLDESRRRRGGWLLALLCFSVFLFMVLTRQEKKKMSLEEYGLAFAQLSLDFMEQDTEKAAQESMTVDITAFEQLTNRALDEIGLLALYDVVFRQTVYAQSLNKAARQRGWHNFTASTVTAEQEKWKPHLAYTYIPNDRPNYPLDMPLTWTMGTWWWHVHWVGAITADKLVREGSVLLDPLTGDRMTNASSFYDVAYRDLLHEAIEAPNKEVDLMPLHAVHGFTYHYIALTRPDLNGWQYPTDLLYSFCGEVPLFDTVIPSMLDNAAYQCEHSIGHGVFYTVALRQLQVKVDVKTQFNVAVGLELTHESVCLGYRICHDAPRGENACLNGFHHSRSMFEQGGQGSPWGNKYEPYRKERKQCLQEYKNEKKSIANNTDC